MQSLSLLLLLLQACSVAAYAWIAGQPGVNSALFRESRAASKRQANCPFNPVHKGVAPYTAPYTYTAAKNGTPGTGVRGIKVPADGDTAHAYTPLGPNNIRGPCPSLNAIHDGNLPGDTTASDLLCLLYQLGANVVPSSLSTLTDITGAVLEWSLGAEFGV
jgi:hypothetical protein